MCNQKIIETCEVKFQEKVASETYIIKIQAAKIASLIQAGNFVTLSLQENNTACLLKRPFSIYDWDKGHVYILYKVKGKVTTLMSKLVSGEKLDIIGPLGNGFTQCKNENILLVGGGIGIAPLLAARKSLCDNNNVVVVHGVRHRSELVTWKDFEVLPHVDDEKGYFVCNSANISSLIKEHKITHIKTCGPIPMMKEIYEVGNKMNVSVEVSLEARMACGFGVCLGCVVSTNNGYKKVCVDGPVFSGTDVW